MAGSPVNSSRPRLLLLLAAVLPSLAHWHEDWANGQKYNYPWYRQEYVSRINAFYCDTDCDARLARAPTVDREFKAMVDLLNQTTGGPRDVYRGAFEGLDEFKSAGGSVSRRVASRATWKHMEGWDSILTAHTSEETLCTSLKLDGNESFTRQLCYDKILATIDGPLFPSPRRAATPQRPAGAQPARLVVVARRPPRRRSRAPHPPPATHTHVPRHASRWSVVEDCCLKFNRTIGHGEDAFFWTDEYTADCEGTDVFGYTVQGCTMVTGMGIVVGRYGRILRTENGGYSWDRVDSPTTAHLHGQSGRPGGAISGHQRLIRIRLHRKAWGSHATPHRSSPVPPRPIIRCRRTCTGSR